MFLIRRKSDGKFYNPMARYNSWTEDPQECPITSKNAAEYFSAEFVKVDIVEYREKIKKVYFLKAKRDGGCRFNHNDKTFHLYYRGESEPYELWALLTPEELYDFIPVRLHDLNGKEIVFEPPTTE